MATTIANTMRRAVFRSSAALAPFSTSASTSQPRLPTHRSNTSPAQQAAGLIEEMVVETDAARDARAEVQDTIKDSFTRNISPDTFISPGHLSPTNLLRPFAPRPDYTLAYPLGPPVSMANQLDLFHRLDMDPRASPMNPWLRAEFCTSMGKIKGRGKTGLQRGNQRKMGKAVRRAKSMGIVAVFGQSVPSENR